MCIGDNEFESTPKATLSLESPYKILQIRKNYVKMGTILGHDGESSSSNKFGDALKILNI